MSDRRACALFVLGVMIVFLAACNRDPQPQPVSDRRAAAAADEGWTLLVRSGGPRWLPPTWWRQQGIDPETLSSAGVEIRHADESVPYLVVDSPEGPGLFFYGVPAPSVTGTPTMGPGDGYTMQLGAGGRPSELMVVPGERPSACQTATEISIGLGEDAVFRSTAPVSPPWLWYSLRPVDGLTVTVTLTDVVVGSPVTLTTTAWGQSSMPQEPDHHLRLLWSGEPIDDHMWDGSGLETWSAVAVVEDGAEHLLGILAPGGTQAPVELTWVDSIAVTWRQRLVASETRGQAWIADQGGGACFQLADADQSGSYVAAVGRQSGAVRYLAGGREGGSGDLYVAHDSGDIGWLGLPWTAPQPDIVRVRETLDVTMMRSVAYLVVAPAPFQDALSPLVEQRRADGLDVAIVSPEAVYDTYGTGLASASSLQALIGDLATDGRLEAILLVGDASADPRAIWNPAMLTVPTMWVQTAHVGATASDYAIATGGGDSPLVAIGRFPVTSARDVETVVDKTLGWEATDRLLLIADDEPSFANLTEQLGQVTVPDLVVDAGLDGARDEVLRWLGDGPGTLVYTGHGSMGLLGDEKLLLLEDGQNWRQPTVVAAWTCLCASFAHPTYASLAEAWLLAPKGVVAVVGPTGETTTAEQTSMALALQASLAEGESLGQALLSAWRVSQSENTTNGFVLLGDPYLQPMVAEGQDGDG